MRYNYTLLNLSIVRGTTSHFYTTQLYIGTIDAFELTTRTMLQVDNGL
jgi:hypothetical protein